MAIHHNLLSRTPLDQVKKVYSHQQALGQCRRWLQAQLPHADAIATLSTSEAARIAAGEPGSAAIGSTLAARLHDLPILFENIEDNPTTRPASASSRGRTRGLRATTRRRSCSPPSTPPAR